MKKLALFFLIGFLTIATSSCGKKEQAAKVEKIPTLKGVRGEVIKASTVEDFYEAVGTVRSKSMRRIRGELSALPNSGSKRRLSR